MTKKRKRWVLAKGYTVQYPMEGFGYKTVPHSGIIDIQVRLLKKAITLIPVKVALYLEEIE